MTLQEVSDYLRVPVATLRRWRMKGTGPPSYKLGGQVRFNRTEVEDWFVAQQVSR